MEKNVFKFDNFISSKRFCFENYSLKLKDTKNEREPYRSEFHRDFDRLIFSKSFRRLAKKTQVHPLADNDNIHNRLTHSLETSSVARSLGLILGNYIEEERRSMTSAEGENYEPSYNSHDISTIIQAAYLAHDIGNPPFGHAGEDVIKNWFSEHLNKKTDLSLDDQEKNDLMNFDGNPQGFRIVTKLENDRNNGGLSLTITTLGAMIKYPCFSDKSDKKFGFYKSEKDTVNEIFKEFGLIKKDSAIDWNIYLRHPLSYLSEVADDICYSLLDISDAVEMGILDIDDKNIKELFSLLMNNTKFSEIINDKNLSPSSKVGKLCAIAINNLTMHAANIYINNFDRFIDSRNGIKDLLSIFTDKNLHDGVLFAKQLGSEKIFVEDEKLKLEIAANEIMGTILDLFVSAVEDLDGKKDINKVSFINQKILKLMKVPQPSPNASLYEKYQCVLDYVAGMTDNFAVTLAQQIKGVRSSFQRI